MKVFLCSLCMALSLMTVDGFALSKTVKHVNINTATVSDLIAVKGFGQKKAQSILQYRKEHGAFSSVSDLHKVKGISFALLKRINEQNPGVLVTDKK